MPFMHPPPTKRCETSGLGNPPTREIFGGLWSPVLQWDGGCNRDGEAILQSIIDFLALFSTRLVHNWLILYIT